MCGDVRGAAFSVHGEIFSVSAKDGGDAVRVTRTAGARTPDEMRRILSMMLGELNASHMVHGRRAIDG